MLSKLTHPSIPQVAGLMIVLAELGGAVLVTVIGSVDAAHVAGHLLLSAEAPMFGPRCHA